MAQRRHAGDGFAEAPPEPAEGVAEIFGMWEQIFSGQAEWLARES